MIERDKNPREVGGAFFCLVEEDKFKHPIGMHLFVTGGKMFELDLIALLFEKVY